MFVCGFIDFCRAPRFSLRIVESYASKVSNFFIDKWKLAFFRWIFFFGKTFFWFERNFLHFCVFETFISTITPISDMLSTFFIHICRTPKLIVSNICTSIISLVLKDKWKLTIAYLSSIFVLDCAVFRFYWYFFINFICFFVLKIVQCSAFFTEAIAPISISCTYFDCSYLTNIYSGGQLTSYGRLFME